MIQIVFPKESILGNTIASINQERNTASQKYYDSHKAERLESFQRYHACHLEQRRAASKHYNFNHKHELRAYANKQALKYTMTITTKQTKQG